MNIIKAHWPKIDNSFKFFVQVFDCNSKVLSFRFLFEVRLLFFAGNCSRSSYWYCKNRAKGEGVFSPMLAEKKLQMFYFFRVPKKPKAFLEKHFCILPFENIRIISVLVFIYIGQRLPFFLNWWHPFSLFPFLWSLRAGLVGRSTYS